MRCELRGASCERKGFGRLEASRGRSLAIRSSQLAIALGVLLATGAQARAQGSIVGTVRDSLHASPLSGVRVAADGAGATATTDAEGRFALRGVPAGSRAVHFQRVGYAPARLAAVVVRDGEASSLDVALAAVVVPLSAVVVTPGTFGVMHENLAAPQSLTREEIETRPSLGEDIYRSVTRLPGVSAGEYSAKFRVRGGGNDEVLVMLDGLELYEPFHLKDLDGALSIVDVQAIGGVDVITGGFSAEYGDRLTGVFDIRTAGAGGARDQRADDGRTHTELGLSLTNARLLNRGQFDGGRGRWLVSARRGYLDVVLKLIGEDEDLNPRYYDALAKVEYQLGDAHTVGAHVLHAADRLRFVEEPGSRLTSDYGNSYGWLTWRASLGRLTAQHVLSAGALSWDRDAVDLFNDRVARATVRDERRFHFVGLREDASLALGERSLLKWGFDAKRLEASYDYANTLVLERGSGGAVTRADTTRAAPSPSGTELGVYGALRLRPLAPLVVEGGARYDRQSYTGDATVSPRVNASLTLPDGTSLRAAWGRFYQSQGIHEIQVHDGETAFQRADLAEHRALGVERALGGVRVRVEGYERRMPRLRARWVNLIGGVEMLPEVTDDRVRIAPDRGDARGVELFVQREPGAGRFHWAGSYAVARAEDRVGGAVVPRPLDQRHTLYLDASYRPGANWLLSAAWMSHSGWPTTASSWTFEQVSATTYRLRHAFGPYYGERMPSYQRLDVRGTRRFALRRGGEVRVFVDVFNVLNRKNPQSYEYFVSGSPPAAPVVRRELEPLLPRLPSLGVSWEF